MEWFYNIPKNGILCKCLPTTRSENYKLDIITRYNEHPLAERKFRNDSVHYALAIPLTVDEAKNLIYEE